MSGAVGLSVLVLLLCCVGWVYTDARARQAAGRPVVVQMGNVRLDDPAVWAVACLVLWILAFPLYLMARQ